MTRLLFTLLLYIAAFVQLSAQSLRLGYCEGMIADDENGGTIISRSGSGTVDLAIRFPEEDLAAYVGNQVTALRCGLPEVATLPQQITAWVRSSQKGTNLVEAILDQPQVGWNELTFATPFDIPAQTELWFGFSYTQSTKLSVISFAGPTNANGCWVGKGGMWTDHSSKGYGSLAIEAVLQGSSLPQWNGELREATLAHPKVQVGNPIEVNCTVRNLALQTLPGFDVAYRITGTGDAEGILSFSDQVPYGESVNVSLQLPSDALADGNNVITLQLQLPGYDDEDMSNNEQQLQVYTYLQGCQRTLLLEEFTTESCGNCPAGINCIHQSVEGTGLADRIIWVCHHAGYGTDWLTTSEASSYTYFYGGNSTYAPAMMIDRTYFAGHSGDEGPVGHINNVAGVSSWLCEAADEPAFVRLWITESKVEGGRLSLHVRVQPYPGFSDLCPLPRINVWVKENHIHMQQQSDYSGLSTGYHENVFRATATGTWGQEIAWGDDGTFESDYTFTLGSSWDASRLSVVAFVSSYSASNVMACQVWNAVSVPAGQASAIHQLPADTLDSPSVYNLFGQRSDSPEGLVIRVGRIVFYKNF